MSIQTMPWEEAVQLAQDLAHYVANRRLELDHLALLEAVATWLPERAYIAGGALTRLFSGVERGDIDVWCETAAVRDAVEKLLLDKPPAPYADAGTNWTDTPYTAHEDDPDDLSGEIFELVDDGEVLPKLQLVGSFFMSAEEQISRFDFTCNQMALVKRDGRLVFLTTQDAPIDAVRRTLCRVHEESPGKMANRLAKYLAKGFTEVAAPSQEAA